ncbi:hypothetical protein RHGRI_010147 [Rhododendron griersonianum]|uniref:C3H1-type domain-containing protein n=1 Tax=Rhododendron griersonianum TaxID=479676 RepID=A0AAV6KHD8_9ERIC|nr:hypothetical protein RHGRI_010147 [Rhododendron griersonianum]
MGSVCAEQHHKFHTSHQLQLLNKKSLLREIDIPPRKLLSRRAAACGGENVADIFADSPRSAEEALMQKFLPYNNGGGDSDDSDADDPYSSDHFRMYEFKVRRCTRSRSHDWTDCPFAHPGEKARRRDPRRYHYSGTVCAEFRRGGCSRGDNCEFAHGVFECWLHPARYRTEACKDGRNCKRKVCFFAHSPRQLRLLPPQSAADSPPPEGNYRRNPNHCCLYCHSPVSASPTSTLMGISHISPPLSPPENHRSVSWVSPISRYGGDRFSAVDSGYKDSLSELICSLEGMNVSDASPHAAGGNNGNLPWVDVCLNNNCEDQQQQQQFVLSPSTPSPSGSRGYFSNCDSSSSNSFHFEDKSNENGLGYCPDLGWVNDLLT